MTNSQWAAVDRYITDLLVPPDSILDATLRASEVAGLPSHQVSPNQGKMLQLLAALMGARTILEIGTLGGYSTIWLARALPPDGMLVTLEADPKCAEVASSNIQNAGLAGIVELRLGQALETLTRMVDEGGVPFDLIFIDADKEHHADYLTLSLKLSRPGSLIIGDNVVRRGEVTDVDSRDPRVRGVRRFYERIAAEPRLSATAIQTVGSKGYDGFALALVRAS